MKNILSKSVLLAGVAALALAAPMQAQSPTPAGTVITNTATASYQDFNGNSYTATSNQTSITVAYTGQFTVAKIAGPDPMLSPYTAYEATFRITNAGNGSDDFRLDSVLVATGITVAGYKIGTLSFTAAQLAQFNDALDSVTTSPTATYDIANTAGSNTVDFTIVYNVDAGLGGGTGFVRPWLTSLRDNAEKNSGSHTALFDTRWVATGSSPGGVSTSEEPTNGGTYTQVFRIANGGSQSATYNFTVSSANAAIVAVSTGGSGSTTVAGGGNQDVTVTFTVAKGYDNQTVRLTFSAVNAADASDVATATYDVTAVEPVITATKEAFADAGLSVNIDGGSIRPDSVIYYRITLANNGHAPARLAKITDVLDASVTFEGIDYDDSNDWEYLDATNAVTTAPASGTSGVTVRVRLLASQPIAPSGTARFVVIRVRVK